MAYYRVRPQLARPGFRAGWPPGLGPGHALQAHFLVDAFVGADLAEQVGERLAVRVTGGDRRPERLALPLRVLCDERGVLVFGVVLDVGVESAAPGRVQHLQQPELLVLDERRQLRYQPVRSEERRVGKECSARRAAAT